MSDDTVPTSTISVRESIANQPAFCAKCHANDGDTELHTCARCKLAKYCSRKCQRDDFPLHKRACKRLSNLREAQDAAESKLLADTIVQTTYRSSHSLAASKFGLASAIEYYLEAIRETDDGKVQESLLARVIFLLAAIEQDEAAVSVMRYATARKDEAHQSDDNNHDTLPIPDRIPRIHSNDDILALFPSSDYNWNTTNLVTLLFIKMKLVANAQTTKTKKVALDQVNQVKNAIHNDKLLETIQTCIPLTPAEAPCLFDATAPFEFWCLLQDLICMTPGVQHVLEELVPIEDDED